MVKGFIDRANRRSMALVGCESIFITGAVTLSAYVLVGDHGRPIFNSFGTTSALTIIDKPIPRKRSQNPLCMGEH